jgi:acetolactate synthase-1/2/3 large subunit
MLVITGEVAEEFFGLGYLQEGVDATLDVNQVYANAVASSVMLSSVSAALNLVPEALRAALSVPGAVSHVSLPDDVSGQTIEPGAGQPVYFPASPANYRAVPRGANEADVAAAFALLTSAKRPLIFLGNGARRALRGDGAGHLRTLVERLAIPVITTPEAKGTFPEDHELSLRTWGSACCEWPQYYMGPSKGDHFDALLILGSALGELATGKWNPLIKPAGPLVQVDLDPRAIGRAFPVDLGIVADVGDVLAALASLAAAADPDPGAVRARADLVASLKADHPPFHDPDAMGSTADPILPQALMRCVQEAVDAVPGGVNFFVDSGNCFGWASHYLAVKGASDYHIALDMGPMGFAVGSVVGGKLADPARPAIAIAGDGAFMMQGSELSTAARYGLAPIYVILGDDNLNMVTQGQAHFFPDTRDPGIWVEEYQLGSPDLTRYAEGLGADAVEVCSPAEAKAALEDAIAHADERGKPQVIVARVDPKAIPPYYQAPAVT